MRRAAALAALVALACAGAALGAAGCGGDEPSRAPAVTGSGSRSPAAAAGRSRAQEATDTLDTSVCRRRDLGAWDKEKNPRDFAPRCVLGVHPAATTP